MNPKNITSKMVFDYALEIKNPRTRNQTIGCLKTFFTHACRMPRLVNVPYAKVPKKNPKYISRERFYEGLKKCTNPKHRLIFRLLFSHGLRKGEVLDCTVSWFGSQKIEGEKHYVLNVTGKGSKDRQLWMARETMKELIAYSKAYDLDLHERNQYLFQSPTGGRYSAGSIRNLTHKYFGVNPHALRHSFATELVNRDVNQCKIKNALGHSSSKTTEIYSHTSIRSMIGVSA